MKIKSFKGGFDNNFCYLVWCEDTMQAVVVDPSTYPLEIFEFIRDNNLIASKILITHTHHDHICYLSDFTDQYSDILVCGYNNTRKSLSNNFRGFTHNDIISIGNIIFTVLYTPGHYDDSLCYWNIKNKIIFTGDTVFVGRPGRTINPYSDISKLYDSIYNVILKLDKDTIIYPGHDYGHVPKVSLAENINSSPFFSCSSKERFIDVMREFEENRK